jgi:hypothetical protein
VGGSIRLMHLKIENGIKIEQNYLRKTVMVGGSYQIKDVKKRSNKMNIAKCKIDKRGRMTLPLSFLKANGIQPEDCEAVIQPIQNNLNTVKVVFTLKGNRNGK